MNKQAKLAFIGCGGFSTSCLYPTLQNIPEIDLVAVCDLKEELAKRNARNFGARSWYTDVEKMLATEKLDGIVVVGLPQMHYQMGKRCLDAGLPIYVEKPSANTYAEALDLAEYAQKKGLFGMVGHMKRHSTCYRMAKTIMDKKEFGGINEIEVRFANGRYPDLKKFGWGLDKGPAHAFLIGQAVHIFDLIRFFCGDVAEIYSIFREVETTDDGGIFGFAVTVQFKSGAIGLVNVNAFHCPRFQMSEYFEAAGYECCLEVRDMMELNYHARQKPLPEFETAGRAQIFSWKPEFTEVGASTAGGIIGYKGEMRHFARSVLGLEKPSADLFDGAKAVQIAEAIWDSSQSGKVVKLGEKKA
ncbi:MAG: Gfo/Idh/MocA family oxidoreductase [Verrucomicrobiae bacterium]|nr:Gfo/Idh/MocA family oxidoreductase [Verrucomicrobiae bacterium]